MTKKVKQLLAAIKKTSFAKGFSQEQLDTLASKYEKADDETLEKALEAIIRAEESFQQKMVETYEKEKQEALIELEELLLKIKKEKKEKLKQDEEKSKGAEAKTLEQMENLLLQS